MTNVPALWEALAQVRAQVAEAARRGAMPPRKAYSALESWRDDVAHLPEGAVTAGRMATAWGALQLILIDAGREGAGDEEETQWRRIRRATEETLYTILQRPEWRSLSADFQEELMPLLADSVNQSRLGRIRRLREAAARFHTLSRWTSGVPHAWRLQRVAEMAYPHVAPRGWFGRLGIDLTPTRVLAVAQAMLEAVRPAEHPSAPLVIGYDSRVHADQLAATVTELASRQGIPVHLCQQAAPLPALLDYLAETMRDACLGLLYCSANDLPVRHVNAVYTGTSYQGIVYHHPTGHLPAEEWCARVSHRAAELLLMPPSPTVPDEGEVTLFQPQEGYCQRLIESLGHPVLTVDGDEELASDLIIDYWGDADALIIVDEMHGASRGYAHAVCEELGLVCDLLHYAPDPLFGALGTATPEPPHLGDLISWVKERREERPRVIGFAFNAGMTRLGVVDEQGGYLSPAAVLSVLTEHLLTEGYPGTPGAILRSRHATRALDRLAEGFAERTLPPDYTDDLPPYMTAPGYEQLAGDPHALHGRRIFISDETLSALPESLLIAGNARGEMIALERAATDALYAAFLVLQCCAAQRTGIGELWARLQERIGSTAAEHATMRAPDPVRYGLIYHYLGQYHQATMTQLAAPAYAIGGCAVLYAGGVPDQFVEWALLDQQGQPAYAAVVLEDVTSAIRLYAEARDTDTTRHILTGLGEKVHELLVEHLKRTAHLWEVVDFTDMLTSPLTESFELSGMLTCTLAREIYSRLQELARPGREAPELLRFVIEQVRAVNPENSRVLIACHLGEQGKDRVTPPPPRVIWESDGET